MTEEEILRLPRIENDEQLMEAIAFLDPYLDNDMLLEGNLETLTELIYEYEERTDVLNKEYRLHEKLACKIRKEWQNLENLVKQQTDIGKNNIYNKLIFETELESGKKVNKDYLKKFL